MLRLLFNRRIMMVSSLAMMIRILPAMIVTVLISCGSGNPKLYEDDPDWTNYSAILEQHVSTGKKEGVPLTLVNYRAIQADARWAGVVRMVQTYSLDKLKNRNSKLAFYTNVYNIATINLIIERGYPASINNLGKGIWDEPFFDLGGRKVSLNHIEHKVIRPLGDARIHFAIVCASVSCPDIRNEAFNAANLDKQFESQTRAFLQNSTKGVRVNKAGGIVHASKLFEWFAEDFKPDGGALEFIKKYRDDIPANARLKTDIEYNWNLNG